MGCQQLTPLCSTSLQLYVQLTGRMRSSLSQSPFPSRRLSKRLPISHLMSYYLWTIPRALVQRRQPSAGPDQAIPARAARIHQSARANDRSALYLACFGLIVLIACMFLVMSRATATTRCCLPPSRFAHVRDLKHLDQGIARPEGL